MRWEQLFADLEAQADAETRAELQAEVAERSRIEVGRTTLLARLGAAVGLEVVLTVPGHGPVTGVVSSVGADWVVLGEPAGREWLVPFGAVVVVRGLPLRLRPEEDTAGRRRMAAAADLRRALRALARDRAEVRLHLRDGSTVTGTVDRVGADHLDLAEHAPGEVRRASAVRRLLSAPLDAVAAVSQAR